MPDPASTPDPPTDPVADLRGGIEVAPDPADIAEPWPAVAREFADAPTLAAVAANHPDTFTHLVAAWSDPDPLAELADHQPMPPRGAVDGGFDLPDSPSVDRGLPLRRDRAAGHLFGKPGPVAPLFDDRRAG